MCTMLLSYAVHVYWELALFVYFIIHTIMLRLEECFDMFQEGRTALLVACWRGFLSIVIILIKYGANTNAQDQVCYPVPHNC